MLLLSTISSVRRVKNHICISSPTRFLSKQIIPCLRKPKAVWEKEFLANEENRRILQGLSVVVDDKEPLMHRLWALGLTEFPESLERWKHIKRGKDLFGKGLGTFHIPKAYAAAQALTKNKNLIRTKEYQYFSALFQETHDARGEGIEASLKTQGLRALLHSLGIAEHTLKEMERLELLELVRREVDPHCVWNFILRHDRFQDIFYLRRLHLASRIVDHIVPVPSIATILRAGYFPKIKRTTNFDMFERLIFADDSCPAKRHLIRFFPQWRDRHSSELDELDILRLRFAEREEHPDRYFFPEGGEAMPPEQLMQHLRTHERRLARGESRVEFDHLEDLKDDGEMRVVRNAVSLQEVAQALRNCAGGLDYVYSVKSKGMIFVALWNTEKKKPIALGAIEYYETFVESNWLQIVVSNNRSAPREIEDRFEKYREQIDAWASEGGSNSTQGSSATP